MADKDDHKVTHSGAAMTALDHLLHAVLARPECDNARLVYADALEEAGDGERAEFIRWQIQRPGEPIRDRWNNLIDWFGDAALPPGSVSWERGFASSVRCSLAAWCGGDMCPDWECQGMGRRDDDGSKCPRCNGTGRTPGHGAETVARHPVERVEFTDREPKLESWGDWSWEADDRGINQWAVPVVFVSYLRRERAFELPGQFCYWTHSSALTALSASAIRWARAEAVRRGLVPDVWKKTTPPQVAAGGG